MPRHNNILCLGVIPKETESEKIYEITWDDFRAAAVPMASYKDSCKPGCEICSTVMEVLSADNMTTYICSRKFQNGELLE